MMWKLVVAQNVAMASLAITLLILRDCAKARDIGAAKWLNALPFAALTVWGVYLTLQAGEAIRHMPPK
jgi:hypothetical protein